MKKILFCAGQVGQRVLDTYNFDEVLAFCDNNANLHGSYIKGKKVISFEELCELADSVEVIVCSADVEIVRSVIGQLTSKGIKYKHYNEASNENDIKNAFTKIYKSNEWGTGESKFYSGTGSHDVAIIKPYIQLLINLIKNNNIYKITEVGCGDFFVMSQVLSQLASKGYEVEYAGLDVVDALIEHNIEHFSSDKIHFLCEDAAKNNDDLPPGELLIIRQVLQHLDNKSILKILSKTTKYKYVLVTEHIYEGEDVKYNVDKRVNESTRLNMFSGVYLDKPPYNYKNIVHLLKVSEDGGVIRTSLIIN